MRADLQAYADAADAVIATLQERLEAATARAERAEAVVEAAKCVRYWHGNCRSGEDVDEQVRCNIKLDDAIEKWEATRD